MSPRCFFCFLSALVNRVLTQAPVREKENLLAYRLASDGPISFAEMDRYEQTLLADAQLATQKIWKKCSAQIPPEPTEAIGKLPVLTEQTLLTCDKFATAFYKPRRRQVMPSDEEECKAQILSWWEKLDAGAHTGPVSKCCKTLFFRDKFSPPYSLTSFLFSSLLSKLSLAMTLHNVIHICVRTQLTMP